MKASLKIILRSDYQTKEGKRQIALQYTAFRKTIKIGIGISIDPTHWSKKTKTIKAGEVRSLFYNKKIQEKFLKGEQIILQNFDHPLSTEEFKNRLNDIQYENRDFYTFIGNEIELLKPCRAEGTIANYIKLINTLKKWKPVLNFADIHLELIQKYHNYELENGNLLSTIYKKHANFKFLIGLAVDKEKIEKNPYEKFEIKKNIKAQNNDILTEDEIKKLLQIYQSGKYTDGKAEVLREFIFSCYTSLSFAEYSRVTYEDLKPVSVGKEEIYFMLSDERRKTNMTYKIPIVSPILISLLGNGEMCQPIFSPLTNQPTNRYLKEIMKEAKINKTITFHRGRHTFRTIAARKGISDSIAERIMGHAEGNDIKDIYTHLQDEDIVKEMLDKWIA